MTLDVAKDAVRYILHNMEKSGKARGSITYFGGEPTIMWDSIIVPLTKWIRENKFPISLSMTTNGTMLDEERLQFMKKNGIHMLLSIDGNKETQDFNRPCGNGASSYDILSEKIPLILKYYPDVTFRGTIYAPTAHLTFKNFVHACELGFKNIYLMPDCRHSWTEEQICSLRQEIGKIYELMRSCFERGVELINFSPMNDIFKLMLKRDAATLKGKIEHREVKRNCYRCGMGTSTASIGYDGSIFGCQEQTSLTEDSIFYLGNIYKEGIEEKRHINLLSTFGKLAYTKCEKEEMCESCILKNICVGFNCPSSAYDLYEDFHISPEITCLWRQWLLEEAIFMNNKLVEQDNQVFKRYLEDKCNFPKGVDKHGM